MKTPVTAPDDHLVRQIDDLKARLYVAESEDRQADQLIKALFMGSGGLFYVIGVILAGFMAALVIGFALQILLYVVSAYIMLVLTTGFILLVAKPAWFTRFIRSNFNAFIRNQDQT
ncbi:MAG: hypothetical protein HUU10_00520 [Bacteroidetes bacterium]|nr:hypothetical protein [Bacteroidota bacterium]